MKVFLSWSGELSQRIAQELYDWIPLVLQRVRPYMTPADIEKGKRWQPEITEQLSLTNFGILCLTPENLMRPWILFEAGALSKVPTAHVVPLLFMGIPKGNLPAPLGQFQAVQFIKAEMLQLLRNINDTFPDDEKLKDQIFGKIFDSNWEELEEKITLICESNSAAAEPAKPSTEDQLASAMEMLQEILALSRQSTSSATDYEKLTDEVTGRVLAALLLHSQSPSGENTESNAASLFRSFSSMMHSQPRRNSAADILRNLRPPFPISTGATASAPMASGPVAGGPVGSKPTGSATIEPVVEPFAENKK